MNIHVNQTMYMSNTGSFALPVQCVIFIFLIVARWMRREHESMAVDHVCHELILNSRSKSLITYSSFSCTSINYIDGEVRTKS